MWTSAIHNAQSQRGSNVVRVRVRVRVRVGVRVGVRVRGGLLPTTSLSIFYSMLAR